MIAPTTSLSSNVFGTCRASISQSGSLPSGSGTFPSKIGLVALAMILTFTGASYAADKIALICSDGKGADDYSLSIDLDRKLANFHMSDLPDADDIPVTRVTDNYVWFQNKTLSDIYSEGKLDRLTGSFHFFRRYGSRAKDYYLRCKPAELP
jgi:hypothetical protein